MVKFKLFYIDVSFPVRLIYIPIWLNSNVNGLTTVLNAYKNLHSNMVKFKLLHKWHFFLLNQIYIPIWLNSNSKTPGVSIRLTVFTFQYG